MDTPDPDKKPRNVNPGRLHGVTLKMILERLVEKVGWEEMAYRVNINCFKDRPTINSSLKLLRKTPWAREKVEALYLRHFSE
jgi:uncharacterized protein (DUF2132 family)